MKRDELNQLLVDSGVEPSKAVVSALLSAFNEEKRNAIVETTAKITKDFEGYVSPEDMQNYVSKEEHSKVVNELTTMKDAKFVEERKAKYKASNFNVDDEDTFSFIDSKLKDASDEEIAAYAKEHPSFLSTPIQPEEKQIEHNIAEQSTAGFAFSGQESGGSGVNTSANAAMNRFIRGE